MRLLRSILLLVLFPPVACSSLHTPLPLTEGPPHAVLSSQVFVGYAQAFRFIQGNGVRDPGYDYEFLVLEKRFPDRWETINEVHRRDPRYDGRAGSRDQTFYFVSRTSPSAGGGLDLSVEGTLGIGKGHEEPGGAGFLVELTPAERGWFVPFDTIRIRQTREATRGRFEETVDLFSRKDGREIPFMRMWEEGVIYRPILP